MAHKDIVSKKIIRRLALDIATRLLGLAVDPDFLELIETEYRRIEDRRADLVVLLRAAETGEAFIMHIEVQNDNRADMPLRMLRYRVDIEFARPGVSVRQHLIYIGSRPLTMADGIDRPDLRYRYNLLDMRDIDCRQLLAQDDPDSLVLAILCDFGGREPQAVVNHIYTRLEAMLGDKPKQLREYLDMIEILAGNRDLKDELKEAQAMLTRYDRTKLPSYELGMEAGMEKGIEKGEARLLRKMLKLKFGPLPREIDEQVLNADTAQIEKWSERVFQAKTLDDVMG